MAQALKRGLHAEGGAINPAEFRKVHGPCPGAPGAPAPGGVISKPVVAAPAAVPATPARPLQ
jgi:hypothetical protein